MKRILGQPCPCCFRKVTKWSFDEAYRRKVANAKASAQKARENGTHKWGRRRKLSDQQRQEVIDKYNVSLNRPSKRALGREYGVAPNTIIKILKTSTL